MLTQLGGAPEYDPLTMMNQLFSYRRYEMCLPHARGAKDEKVASLLYPGDILRERLDLRLVDRGGRRKVVGLKRLALWKARLVNVAGKPASFSVSKL